MKNALIPAALALVSAFVNCAYAQSEASDVAKLAPPPIQSEPSNGVELDNEKLLELIKQLSPVDFDQASAKKIAESQNINLTPEMILAIRTLLAQRELALNQPVANVNLNVASERLNLSSIQPPIKLNIKRGFDTFVEFYDLTGTPWPVEKFISVGSTEQFTAASLASVSDDVPSNIVRVTATAPTGDTTMTVQLRGVKETVNFRLVHNQLNSDADYKRVFTVPLVNSEPTKSVGGSSVVASKHQADAAQLRVNEFMRAANESFEPFFTGDVPVGAISIPVLEGDAMAWLYEGFLYVRSRIEILTFPTSQHGVQSFSGWYVHKMAPYPQVSYYQDSKSLTIILDDDELMSAINHHKIMNQQKELTLLNLQAIGG